jgi:hypothetical protein
MAEGQHIRHQAPDCVEVLVLPHLLKFAHREIVCTLYTGYHSTLHNGSKRRENIFARFLYEIFFIFLALGQM